MNQQITEYILKAPEEQRKLMEQIRNIIHDEIPDIIENIKWSRPVFSRNTDIVYFKTEKTYFTLGFFKHDRIKENAHLLEGTGKSMRHVKLRNPDDLQLTIIRNWLKEIIK
jgi:hypothetical protein